MPTDVKAVLRESAILARLTDEDIDHFLRVADERRFDAGDVLIDANSDRALGMWVIIDGSVSVSRDGRHLATLGRGDHVGEMALIADIKRSADVVADGPVNSLQISRWELRGLIVEHPDIALSMMDAMVLRLAEQNASS